MVSSVHGPVDSVAVDSVECAIGPEWTRPNLYDLRCRSPSAKLGSVIHGLRRRIHKLIWLILVLIVARPYCRTMSMSNFREDKVRSQRPIRTTVRGANRIVAIKSAH